MKIFHILFLLSINFTAFGSSQLEFHWPSNSRCTITETSVNDGKKGKLKYQIRTHADNDGNLVLEWGDYEFLYLNGLPMESEEIKWVIKNMKSTLENMPGFVISKEGEFIDLTDYEKLVQSSIDTMLLSNPGEIEHGEKLREMMHQASFKNNVIKSLQKKYWDTWVGSWVGVEIQEKEKVSGITNLSLSESSQPIEIEYTLNHLGEAKNFPGSIHLVVEGKSSEDISYAFLSFLLKLAPDFRNDPDYWKIRDSTVSFVYRAELIADPDTMKPYLASMKKEITIDGRDEPYMNMGSSEFEFKWHN